MKVYLTKTCRIYNIFILSGNVFYNISKTQKVKFVDFDVRHFESQLIRIIVHILDLNLIYFLYINKSGMTETPRKVYHKIDLRCLNNKNNFCGTFYTI